MHEPYCLQAFMKSFGRKLRYLPANGCYFLKLGLSFFTAFSLSQFFSQIRITVSKAYYAFICYFDSLIEDAHFVA
jgi:hypothetical protein